MSFNEEEIKELQKNKFVKKVTTKTISFTKEFKEHFIEESNKGKGPTRIFVESDISPYILGGGRIKIFSKRVKTKYKNNESLDDKRGKKATGRKKKTKKKELSLEEQLDKIKHENLMLQAEINLLKKMEFLVEKKKLKNLPQKKDIN